MLGDFVFLVVRFYNGGNFNFCYVIYDKKDSELSDFICINFFRN